MTTAKPRYKGGGAGTLIRDFSDELKDTLRGYYPHQTTDSDPSWEHPADAFVEHILSEAYRAVSHLHWRTFDVTTSEIIAEHKDLLKTLNRAHTKLQSLSREFDRLLGHAQRFDTRYGSALGVGLRARDRDGRRLSADVRRGGLAGRLHDFRH